MKRGVSLQGVDYESACRELLVFIAVEADWKSWWTGIALYHVWGVQPSAPKS